MQQPRTYPFWRYLAVLPLVALLLGLSASPGEDMVWSGSRRLSWNDFQGTPNLSSPMRAQTYSRVNYSFVCTGSSIRVTSWSEFVPEKSWVKETPSENLLRHEQGHFDISEWFARKLKKHLSSISGGCSKGKQYIEDQAQIIFDEWNNTQDLYDEETNHSKNIEAQRSWEKKIAAELKALESWANR